MTFLGLRESADQERDEVDEDSSFIDAGSHSEHFNEADSDDEEQEEVEDTSSFVAEAPQLAGVNGDQVPSWASFGAALSSIEGNEEKMCAVGHWVKHTS